jgi:RNA polymerase II subunit A C-terminal domain phosphatase
MLTLCSFVQLFSSLFPCGDSMVCIVDDREDVWNYARNLVHVKPYVWFTDVGDINGMHLPSLDVSNQSSIPPIMIVDQATNIDESNGLTRGEKRKLDEQIDEILDKDEIKKKLKEQDNE